VGKLVLIFVVRRTLMVAAAAVSRGPSSSRRSRATISVRYLTEVFAGWNPQYLLQIDRSLRQSHLAGGD
jgi:hypothetical protein